MVAGERVVGMVARRDLLRLVARSDEDIRADLERRLEEEIEALRRLDVEFTGGVVTVDSGASALGRQLLDCEFCDDVIDLGDLELPELEPAPA